MTKYYLLEEAELKNILQGYCKFVALQGAGVNNWEYYGEALSDMISDWVDELDLDLDTDWTFKDIAEDYMKAYKTISF